LEEDLKVGQYVLVRRIGAGGMAEVWEARHIHLGHRVAVKFLLPEFARNQELQERFLNEGKRQAQLQHPNIVPAVDFFQLDGRSFLVMHYVDGRDLETRLEKGNPPLSLDEIHDISWDVLSALGHAHSLGVVHRDVKPANMLMDQSGRTLLMDFGIAKALHEQRNVTLTSLAMGTPDYMSPEQIINPRNVDGRSDIYSFGCVLYAMLTGRPPFGSDSDTAFHVQDCHVRTPPPPLVYANPDVPNAIEEVVLRCLEKDPGNRYQTCGAVMTALDGAISGKPTPVDTAPVEPKPYSGPLTPTPTKIEAKAEDGGAGPRTTIAAQGAASASASATLDPISTQGPDSQAGAPKSLGKYILAIAAGIAVIAGIGYFAMRPKNVRESKDPSQMHYGDPALDDCRGEAGCLQRKAQADKLSGLSPQDWKNVEYNNPLLQDCMNYQPCIERKIQADKLLATKDWQHADKSLRSDCMAYQPCTQIPAPVRPVQTVPASKPSSDDAENTPDCCNNAANPAACRKIKKLQGVQDNCHPLMGTN
jgi:eukaryotic-like serine/threonine-protein kinase